MIILHQTSPCQLQPIYFRCVLFSSHLQFLLPFMNDDKYCDFFFIADTSINLLSLEKVQITIICSHEITN